MYLGNHPLTRRIKRPALSAILVALLFVISPSVSLASHDTIPPTDDHADNVSDATVLTLGSPTSGDIEAVDDRDYFVFTVPVASEGHEFSIVTSDPTPATPETDTVIILLDGISTAAVEFPILGSDDCSLTSVLSCLTWEAPVNGSDSTYFVRLQHAANGVGDYEIEVSDLGTAAPVSDDHSDVSGVSATLIVPTASAVGEIETAGDIDFFRFVSTEGNLYDIDTSTLAGGMDSVIFLYAPDGTSIIANNDDCGSLASCVTWTAPTADTYFVSVQHFSSGLGTYLLTITDNGADPGVPDDHGDVGDITATLLTLGSPTGGDLETLGDRDFFRFHVAVADEGDEFSIVTTDPSAGTAETDTVIILYDSDGTTPLVGNDDCSTTSVLSCLTPDWESPVNGSTTTYYVEVRHYANGVGDYEIEVTNVGTSTLVDDHADVGDITATLLTLGSPTGGDLETLGDRDFFRFHVVVASEGNEFSVVISDPSTVTDTVIFLYDSDGTTLLASNDDCSTTSVLSCLTPDWESPVNGSTTTYYVEVRHYANGVGDYEITVADEGPPSSVDDHGNVGDITATLLTLGSPTGGDLEILGDRDFFRFHVAVASEGNEFGVAISDPTPGTPETDTVIFLYGSDGTTLLASNDDCNSSVLSCLTPDWESPVNGSTTTYYVEVRHYANGVGDYEIEVTDLGTAAPISDDHSNVGDGTATLLTLGSPTGGDLETVGDLDYFRFVVLVASEGFLFTFNITDPSPSTAETDTVVTVYDTDGTTPLAGNDDCNSSVLSCANWNATTAGTYFVEVRHYSDGIGDYTLTVTDTGGP